MELLFLLVVVMLVVLFIQSRSGRKRQQKQAEQIKNGLVPGAWVMTTSGFYGQFVEQDGEVVILQTVDGTETFWLQRAVAQVVDEPPFAATQASGTSSPKTSAAGAEVIDVESQDSREAGNEGAQAAESDSKAAVETGQEGQAASTTSQQAEACAVQQQDETRKEDGSARSE